MTPTTLAVVLGLLWSLWLIEALVSVLSVRKLWRSFDREAANRPERREAYRPPATVIAPFKGVEPDLPAALDVLCTQDYPEYELICVVDSEDDPAAEVIRAAFERHPDRPARLLVSGPAEDQSQKIHNQLYAIRQLEPEADPEAVWAFADSDAVPDRDWLASLVGPLEHRHNGMTTGYRWLVPDVQTPSRFWSSIASVINSSVACSYRQYRYSQAWGGAMALRVETAREGDLAGWLEGALTDDYQFTRMCRALDQRVYFVPRALVATPVTFDRPGFWRFARRQYMITRVYNFRLWLTALGLLVSWLMALASVVGVMIAVGMGHLSTAWAAAAGGVALAVAVMNQLRSMYRRRVIVRAFGREMLESLTTTLRLDRWVTPLWMAIHAAIVLSSAVGKTVRWRGMAYRVEGPQTVERVA
ncbi:MAG: glycosyltransferase family 2 protein [Phycisphaeraceae bacterium]|nr:glycosyltransferase family 2 protein [Phycisphaeraceae bacterium]